MNKSFVLLMAAISLFVSFGLISKSLASGDNSAVTAPTATPTEESSPLLYLDRVEVVIPGPPGYRCREKCDGNMIINVIARRINVEEKKNVYNYTVSGGRILDDGQNVRWDLSSARPGTYTIKVAVGDGEKTKEATETITVRECECSGDCFCPTISVIKGRYINVGDNITFVAEVSGGTATDITYNWTVSQGEIIEGQGTPEITVKPNREKAGSVKATVEIGGEMCAECVRTASATAKITK